MNLFSNLMRVFNLNLLDLSAQMENPKVFSSFSLVWITMTFHLKFNILMCSIMTLQKEIFN